jgi:hypothetical protein
MTSFSASSLSKEMVNKQVKNLSWFQQMMLCMNVEIHKENYSQYLYTRKVQKQNKQILKNQRDFANDSCHRASEELIPSPSASRSNSTIPYTECNTSRVHWSDFDDVSSKMKAKGKYVMEERERKKRTPMTLMSDLFGTLSMLFSLFGVSMSKGG